jgi:hypothetical protein
MPATSPKKSHTTSKKKPPEEAAEKRPPAALHSSCVTAAYGVRLIPQDLARLASVHFSTAS